MLHRAFTIRRACFGAISACDQLDSHVRSTFCFPEDADPQRLLSLSVASVADMGQSLLHHRQLRLLSNFACWPMRANKLVCCAQCWFKEHKIHLCPLMVAEVVNIDPGISKSLHASTNVSGIASYRTNHMKMLRNIVRRKPPAKPRSA